MNTKPINDPQPITIDLRPGEVKALKLYLSLDMDAIGLSQKEQYHLRNVLKKIKV